MNLCLLTSFHSNHQRSSFVHRLAEEAQKQNVTLHLVNPSDISMSINDGHTEVTYHGQPLPKFDLTHYALRWDDEHTWQIVEVLKNLNYLTVPTQRMPLGDTITMARLFARSGIRTPRTWVLPHANQVPVIMGELVFPCMFRVRKGQKGRSVYKVSHMGEALAAAEQLAHAGLGLIVQEILEPTGVDIRAVVVGERVVAAVERTAANDYLRPAEDNNALVVPTVITDAEAKMAVAAARLYNAPYAAVNFLRRPGDLLGGPILLEVSRAPVLTESERATGINIAGAIIEHLIVLAKKSKGNA
jgi:ribosomal protein S6--L-glutamate ligase